MNAAFDRAVTFVLAHEGGYINSPADPGGETKYGISARAYPGVDIANLTLNAARDIYRRDYWTPLAGDEMPDQLALVLFDSAVNRGLKRTSKWLQCALNRINPDKPGLAEDGVLGPATGAACRLALERGRLNVLVLVILALRLRHYADLRHSQAVHLGGWMIRVSDLMMALGP